MTTMTSPPEVRIQVEEAAGAPSGITRRREVPESGRVRGASTPRRTLRTGRVAATRTVRPPERRAAAPVRRPGRTAESRPASAPQAPFAVLVIGMLGGALVGLVLLNAVLAQQAFTLHGLQRENQRLDDRKQALQEGIARETDPQVLHAKARRLGMRDTENPVFADPRRGR